MANRTDVTVFQAVEFWFKYSAETHTKGDSTQGKYEVFLHKRLLPWCNDHKKRLISAFAPKDEGHQDA